MSRNEPPWPLNELARTDRLTGYGVPESPPEPLFGRLTRLASRHFGTPVALVGLTGEARRWCEARFGGVPEAIGRNLSFHAFAIPDDRVLVVSDTAADERFAGNELVAGPPHLRFYAGAPLKTPEGRPIGVFCIADTKPLPEFDGESRRDLEAFAGLAMDQLEACAAQSAAARFRTLIEQTPQFMWVNRADGAVEFVNAAWRQYTGIDWPDRDRWDFVHGDDRKRFLDLRTRAIADGTPYQLELRVRRADAAWRWLFTHVVPIREEGRITSWIGTAVDIHDIRRAQQAAEEADRSKGRFLASASHDLRQPMQSILLFAGALRGHIADEPGRAVLDRLQQGLDTLKDLLDSLLDISRLDAGIVTPQIEEFCIADLIGPLSASFAPIAEAKGLGWQVVPCTGRVRSDRVLLGRMLRNLVDNAIRYTERGRILVNCTPNGQRLRVEVHDTGIGIAPEQQRRIFEEFHQVGNPERDRDRGLGLGLAVVRRLSTLLDHPVEMLSHPGRGSIFSVSVPLARPVERSPNCAAAPQPVRATDARIAADRRLAVVVEDDAIVMMGLATMLREWGFEVLAAAGADQALARLSAVARRPDVVLADYRLRQGRVGTEAILRIREMVGERVPAIIITGEIGPEPQRDAAAHDIALVHKPVTPRLLEAALARHLGAVRPG